jgi:hypothetical protein
MVNQEARELMNQYPAVIIPLKASLFDKLDKTKTHAEMKKWKKSPHVRYFHKFLEDNVLLDYTPHPTRAMKERWRLEFVKALQVAGPTMPQDVPETSALTELQVDHPQQLSGSTIITYLPGQQDEILRCMAGTGHPQPGTQDTNFIFTRVSLQNWEDMMALPRMPACDTEEWKAHVRPFQRLIAQAFIPKQMCIARTTTHLEITSPYMNYSSKIPYATQAPVQIPCSKHMPTLEKAVWIIQEYWHELIRHHQDETRRRRKRLRLADVANYSEDSSIPEAPENH